MPTSTHTQDSAAQSAAVCPVFEAKALSVVFSGRTVLDALDWQTQPAQVIGLLGRNGAGKTTLLETLLGLRNPNAGDAYLFGEAATNLTDAVRAKIGYVPQASDMFEWLNPKQLLNYFRAFYPRWNTTRAEGLMSRWNIPSDRPIGKLSQGEQQRLSIIRALAPQPELLVLDEPVASLDPVGRRDFLRELVEEVLDHGTTIVFSTHILSDLERVAFDVAFLNRGKIALQAPLDDLIERSRRLCGSEAARAAFIAENRLTVLPAPQSKESTLVRWAHEQDIATQHHQLAIEHVTLDDLFMELTQ